MTVSIKLCLDVRNDEYVILCNFGDRTMSGFEVIEKDLLGSPLASPQTSFGVHLLLLFFYLNA